MNNPSFGSPNHQSNTQQKVAEIAAVFITGAGKFVFMDWLGWKLPFILTAMMGWIGYVVLQARRKEGLLQHWGFRKDNFWLVLRMILPFAAIAVVSFFVIGFYQNTVRLTWHIIPILVLYPLWGTIQQFLVIGLVAGNLQDLQAEKKNTPMIIFVTALLFGALHYPNYWLIAATFLLALLYGYIYLRARNVFVLGLLHGWLGALFFYTVVGRDPFMEVFGRFIN